MTLGLLSVLVLSKRGFPGGASAKEPACQYRRRKRHGLDPCVGKIPWRRAWQSTPVFLPGKVHGQWSLVGYKSMGVAKSWTWLSNFHYYATKKQTNTRNKENTFNLIVHYLEKYSSLAHRGWHAHLHLWKFTTWMFICRGLTVLILKLFSWQAGSFPPGLMSLWHGLVKELKAALGGGELLRRACGFLSKPV